MKEFNDMLKSVGQGFEGCAVRASRNLLITIRLTYTFEKLSGKEEYRLCHRDVAEDKVIRMGTWLASLITPSWTAKLVMMMSLQSPYPMLRHTWKNCQQTRANLVQM